MRINTSVFTQNRSGRLVVPAQLKKQNLLKAELMKLASNATEDLQKDRSVLDKAQEEIVMNASMDNYVKTDGTKEGDLSGLSTETLKSLAALMQKTSTLTKRYKSEVNLFRENLNSFDTTITKYENMLTGNEAIPENLTTDSIKGLITQTKGAKNIYQKNGSELLQNRCEYYAASIEASSRMGSAISGEDYSDVKDMKLEFDANAANVYDEIDRVFGHLESIDGKVNESLASIYTELEKRGVHDIGYQLYREQKNSGTGFIKLNPQTEEMYSIASLLKALPTAIASTSQAQQPLIRPEGEDSLSAILFRNKTKGGKQLI